MPKHGQLITSAQLAARLGVNVKTITRKAANGTLPYVHKLDGIRGAYLFDPDAIAELREPADRRAS